eukprot:PhM_4_TR5534/c0_g1_i1/m.102718/K07767/KATNA1; katanin p60 ATPase-containing subunit A1
MAVREIEASVTKAREFAALSDYDAALTFYTGLDKEIEIQSNHASGIMKSRWEALRMELTQEAMMVREMQAELRLFVNPAEAARADQPVRRTRATSNPHDNYNSNGGAPSPVYVPSHDNRPVRPARSRGDDEPAPHVGNINAALYGDPDKFGPDINAPPAEPPRGRWNGGGGGGGGGGAHHHHERGGGSFHNENYNRPPPPQPVRRTASSGPAGRPTKEKVKPPLPQFNKGGGRDNKGKGKAAEGIPGRPAFQPRPGDDELAALIQADILLGNLNVKWDDVAGLDEAKESLKEAMVLPLLLPEFFQGCRQPHKGILMYGPPGTGKTMLAKAASTQCETTFFNVSPTTLASKWRGDSERLVRVLFEMARHYAPSTIFIDEIDALCSQRGSGEHEASRRMKTEILTQIDGVQSMNGGESKLVIVLGATNMPWEIDDGFLRRLSKRIYIPLPNPSSRVELLKITTKGITIGDDVKYEDIASSMDNYSGSDISAICKEASLMALRRLSEGLKVEDIKQRATELQKELCSLPLTRADFMLAMKRVRSSVNQSHIAKYEKWTEEFGCM